MATGGFEHHPTDQTARRQTLPGFGDDGLMDVVETFEGELGAGPATRASATRATSGIAASKDGKAEILKRDFPARGARRGKGKG